MDFIEQTPTLDATRAGLLAVGLAILFFVSPFLVRPPAVTLVFLEVGILFLLYTLVLIGVNLQFGHAGLVNFGPVAFFAVGGYATAMLTAQNPYAGIGLGLPWPVGLGVGILGSVALGLVLGFSTLRLRDDFLAIVTLAVAEIIHGLVGTFQSVTGGGLGLGDVPRPLAAMTVDGPPYLFAVAFLFGSLALLAYGVFNRLVESPYGRVLHAVRADEQVADSLGKHVFRYKVAVFVYGSGLAGFAGGLYALYVGAVSPGFFTINVTVLVWVGMLLGGAGNDRGVIAGLALIMGFQLATRFLNEQLPAVSGTQFGSLRLILVGLLLILIVRYRPEGLWGDARERGVAE